jgi:catechol 2,3-dioxygenase-like lactoylglutathione lyase family enzyme
MKANHIHFHVRDVGRSKDFYKTWFGLQDGRDLGEVVFLTDTTGFDFALSHDPSPAPLPPWFHFGFTVGTADRARQLYQRMHDAGVPMKRGLYESANRVAFFCYDPDGHLLEVYWE